jgi:FkbM family methyltransferase
MSSIDIIYKDSITTLYLYPWNEIVSDTIRGTHNFFEINFLDYIYNNYKNHKEIIDIGSNIGNHSVFFSKYLNCETVHCFEPVQNNIELLEKNLIPLNNKTKIYKCALSNKIGTLPLYNSQSNNYGGFSLHSYSNGSSFKVLDTIEVTTLDSYNFDNVTMIKIDVENHENEVLEGAKDTIRKHKPIIFLENLNHGYPHVVPEKEPHMKIMTSYNYKKVDSNICGSFMDLWVPNN